MLAFRFLGSFSGVLLGFAIPQARILGLPDGQTLHRLGAFDLFETNGAAAAIVRPE